MGGVSTFRNGRLAHTGFSNEHRVVLSAPRQDLDAAPDLIVTPNHRVQLPLPRCSRQVPRISGKGLVLALWVLCGKAFMLEHLPDKM